MKIGLNEAPFESMRTPDEIAQEQDREAHLGGYCLGAPACWFCENDIDEAKAEACADAFRPFADMFRAKK